MISLMTSRKNIGCPSKTVYESYRGKSTDVKPILDPDRNGSDFYEFDTRKVWIYDGENQIWVPQ